MAHLARATRLAAANGTTGAEELLANGLITEDAYYRTLAEHAGLDFIAPEAIVETLDGDGRPDAVAIGSPGAWCRLGNGTVRALVAPDPGSPAIAGKLLASRKRNGNSLALTLPSALRNASVRRVADRLGEAAAFRLAKERPGCSAMHGASAWHGFFLAAMVFAGVSGFLTAPGSTWLAMHAFASLFFFASIGLRLAATIGYRRQEPKPAELVTDAARPVYSIIVALYREAPVAADLVASLKLLNWPRSKTEIKLVCEIDDLETRAALEAQGLDRRFEIVVVPSIGPRTKPKALNYALPFCKGSLVTLFDAEDRPHPDQLDEAWRTFATSDARLAALQAPLVIANPRRNWLTALFHVEYAALFLGLLPWLTRRGLPIPLGGTSTHFRRSALEASGCWDAHNMTEDADLGFRLWRAGYRIGTISLPTLEDAPDNAAVWLRQRTRWIKGWMQTWIVDTRPGLRRADTPLAGSLVLHTMLAGTVVCSMLFPATLLFIAYAAIQSAASGTVDWGIGWLALIDLANIVLAFGVHAALGMRTVKRGERLRSMAMLPALPAYWLLMSLAGWRAFFQYFREPFLWEKTPHAPYDRRGARHRS